MTAGGGGHKPALHEVEPREQIGAKTGDRYEFQYHQAAADALQVLDDGQVACVYCEWHDDYVIEAAGVVTYRFHQVKTRSASQGPWTVNEFFGVQPGRGRKSKKSPPKPATATTDSIFGRLYDHIGKFGPSCEWFVLVSDAATSGDFEALLKAIRSAANPQALSGDEATAFGALHAALMTAFPSLTPEALFSFLQRLFMQEALGKLGDLKSCRTLIGGRIYEMSEVNLTMSEAQKIGAELVAAVRERSHRVLATLPTTGAELRSKKALVLEDVLRILSLSTAGYRELQSGGREAVVALSRLHRLCKRSGVSDALIPELCRLKTNWEAWWIAQRHIVNALDHLALKRECADALSVHVDGKMSFDGLRTQAKALATKYAAAMAATPPLTEELVFGLLLALAVEAES